MSVSLEARLHQAAKLSVLLLIFVAPISRGLFNSALLLVLLFSVLSTQIRSSLYQTLEHTVVKVALVLLAFIFIGGLYSPAPKEFIFRQLKTYGLFLLFPFFIAILDDKKWQKRAMLAFASSLILIVFLTYLDVWVNIPKSSSPGLGLGNDHSIFSDYVVQSIISIFFVGVCLYLFDQSTSQRSKIFWLVLVGASIFSVIFLLSSRTGFILLFCVFALIAYQRLSGKYLIWGGVLGLLILVALIWMSPIAMSRINLAIYEFKTIQDIKANFSFSLRFGTWLAAWDMFIQQPVFGRGTGSYAFLASNYFKDCTWLCVHPHNQYLFFMVENGLIGMMLYLALIFFFIRMAVNSEPALKYLVHIFALILIINSLLNAPFWFNREAYFSYTMMALLIAMMATSVREKTAPAPLH
jgi:O-antigen ligase